MKDGGMDDNVISPALTAREAQGRLLEGNKRYKSGAAEKKEMGKDRRIDLIEHGQHPWAIVLACSDSRVPPELIFDQGLGDLFTIRVAGNIVDSVTLGSIEYGAEHLGSPLLVVLGHSNCGAVQASVDGGDAPGSIGAILDKIKPTVDKLKAGGVQGAALYAKVEDENIMAVMAEIKESPVIKHLMTQGRLEVIGAKYHLDSGRVEFYSRL